MRLEAIAGQPRAVEQLSRALEGGRVAHAYAFVGPAGAGRFTTALAFASELLAADATRGHPDLHVVTPTPPESKPKGARATRIGAIRGLERRAAGPSDRSRARRGAGRRGRALERRHRAVSRERGLPRGAAGASKKRPPAPDGRHAAGPGGAEGGIAPGGSST